MNTPSSIGQIIRELRRQRNMTGYELGRLAGISQPKLSKIESGKASRLVPLEVMALLNILQASETIQQQVADLLTERRRVTPETVLRNKYDHDNTLNVEHSASHIRIFMVNYIPALLQTPAFRQGLLKAYGFTDEADVRLDLERLEKRQEVLWDGGKKLHFILHETALYSVFSDARTQIRQLDRLEWLSQSSGIKIGILPFRSGLSQAEHGTICIYDNSLVVQPIVDDLDRTSTDGGTIAACRAVFDAYEKKSAYGELAVKLIREAITYIN